jgi:3-methyladenine DNA glycosylase AlkD
MEAAEILTTLKKLGKPQTAAIYKRHGSGDHVFGVLTSEIGKLKKKIKVDHALALELWKTGNAEARILALQVADPGRITRKEADRLVADGPHPFVGCYLSELVAKSPSADEIMQAWMKSRDEFTRENGYGVLASRLKHDPESVPASDAKKILATIEREIHGSANRARYAMNGAVMAIGIFKPELKEQAVATAKRIGKVEVDHGETGCKTPDAVAYIEKAARRKLCP